MRIPASQPISSIAVWLLGTSSGVSALAYRSSGHARIPVSQPQFAEGTASLVERELCPKSFKASAMWDSVITSAYLGSGDWPSVLSKATTKGDG